MITLIVAMGHNNEIGMNNDLLWHITSDLKHFKNTTTEKTVVMGRKTYESIGKPLPNRKNIVLTSKLNPNIKGCYQTHSVSDILTLQDDVFVIGGGKVYEQFLPYADQLIITHVDSEYPNADTFFPHINYDDWDAEEILESEYDNEPNYTIIRYSRKPTSKEK